MENVYVKTLLFRGNETHFEPPLKAAVIGRCEFTGALRGALENWNCPKCQSNKAFIKVSSCGGCFFCANDDCLREDAACSKSKPRIEANPTEASEVFGLGHRYRNAHISKVMLTKDQIDSIFRWLQNGKNMIFFQGVPGTGKTYFCCAVANYLLEEKKEVQYLNIRRFYEAIQKAIAEGRNQYAEIKKFTEKKYLIIDDLGASTNSEWQKEILLDMVDQRYSSQQPTIITTNLTNKELYNSLSERTARRLLSKENLNIVVGESGKIERINYN